MKIDMRYAIVAVAALGPTILTRSIWFLAGLPWEPTTDGGVALVMLSIVPTTTAILGLFVGGTPIEREFRWFK